MNELKLGHSVIGWNFKYIKYNGKYWRPYDNDQHIILVGDNIKYVENCKIDPEATEFLPGDEVQVGGFDYCWFNAEYVGYNKKENAHAVREINGTVSSWSDCRYPQEKEDPNTYTKDELRSMTLEELTEIINGDK